MKRADSTAEAQPFNPDSEQSVEDDVVPNEEGGSPDRPYTIRSQGVGEANTSRSGTVVERTLGEHTSISTGTSGRTASWLLVPYVHPFSVARIALFLQAVGHLLPRTFHNRELASKLFTPKIMALLLHSE